MARARIMKQSHLVSFARVEFNWIDDQVPGSTWRFLNRHACLKYYIKLKGFIQVIYEHKTLPKFIMPASSSNKMCNSRHAKSDTWWSFTEDFFLT